MFSAQSTDPIVFNLKKGGDKHILECRTMTTCRVGTAPGRNSPNTNSAGMNGYGSPAFAINADGRFELGAGAGLGGALLLRGAIRGPAAGVLLLLCRSWRELVPWQAPKTGPTRRKIMKSRCHRGASLLKGCFMFPLAASWGDNCSLTCKNVVSDG
jgi:hypothetical protein